MCDSRVREQTGEEKKAGQGIQSVRVVALFSDNPGSFLLEAGLKIYGPILIVPVEGVYIYRESYVSPVLFFIFLFFVFVLSLPPSLGIVLLVE